MKKLLLFFTFNFLLNIYLDGQVTQINNNKSLVPHTLLNPNLAVVTSGVDQTLWVTDGTLAGTFQLTDTITSVGTGVVLNGKYIFAGSTVAAGSEIFVTDGTKPGTKLLKDIYPGATGSAPDAFMVILHGYVYFTAASPNEGRELWRTDGTPGNTTLVKDIVPGPTGSFGVDSSELFSNGTYLLFDVKTAADGNELWRSDGTAANTFLLKDINPGILSSNPRDFYPYKNIVLFAATDAAHGDEVWTTDGTSGGTALLKDINPGPDSSTYINVNFGAGFLFAEPVFYSFHLFNNHLFFMANDGVHGSAIWVTDGTTTNTSLLKVVETDTSVLYNLLLQLAINLPGKFIFSVSNAKDRFELWQSDGTTNGTQLFKSFTPGIGDTTKFPPIIYINFSFDSVNHTINYPLFHGNFFFSANGAEGEELWMSDGTVAGTKIVKDINPGVDNGLTRQTYLYTTTGLFFAADDGTDGNELWKTDGTVSGTSMVKDIFLGAHNADPRQIFICNNKVLFTATDADPDSTLRDLYVVDGAFSPLPVQLLDFTVTPKTNDALLQWSTSQEINSRDFTVQSSDDAQNWKTLGSVPAAGNSSVRNNYSFTDIGVMNSGKSIIYYRLVTTDIDGKTENSNIISLKLKGGGQWNVQLFSNPVHDNVKVLLSGITGIAELSVNDITGKTIYKKQIQNQNGLFSIPINLQSGVYILVTKTNNEMKAIKFIRE